MKANAIFAFAVFATAQWTLAAEKNGTFEGVMSATLTRAGTEAQQIVFTRKSNLLRIENTTSKLEPVNIVDFAAKKLTIVYPHNTTFVRVDLAKKNPVGEAASFPGTTASSTPVPNMSPSMPTGRMLNGAGKMPELPAPGMGMPQMQVPAIPVGPGAGILPMPGMFGPAELKKTDQTKQIQGFDCTLYTIAERGQNFEIWATNDAPFFPFRLVERDYLGRRFGPQMIEESWAKLLRDQSLFALEATLKMEAEGHERLSFKIDKIEKKKIADDQLFQPPDKYLEIEVPGF